jgi:hypothetical protein
MNTDSLFEKWTHVGVNFPAFEPSIKEPLIEELIAQTSKIGRYEPRLIEAMAGWIQMHGDLINTSLMHRNFSYADTAVIGVLCDILDSKESSKFRLLSKYCVPKSKGQMLFYSSEASRTMKVKAIENETDINLRWNLYFVSLRIKTDSILSRQNVFKRNHNLARRALFGANMRTEILNYLLAKKRTFLADIANALGYRYHRVIDDINTLLKDGVLRDSFEGRKRFVELEPSFEKFLSSIPF